MLRFIRRWRLRAARRGDHALQNFHQNHRQSGIGERDLALLKETAALTLGGAGGRKGYWVGAPDGAASRDESQSAATERHATPSEGGNQLSLTDRQHLTNKLGVFSGRDRA